jgi:hypothetical protein
MLKRSAQEGLCLTSILFEGFNLIFMAACCEYALSKCVRGEKAESAVIPLLAKTSAAAMITDFAATTAMFTDGSAAPTAVVAAAMVTAATTALASPEAGYGRGVTSTVIALLTEATANPAASQANKGVAREIESMRDVCDICEALR